MTFIPAALLAPVLDSSPGPFGPPLLSQLPAATNALAKKYSDPQLQLALNQLDPPTRSSLVNYDIQRVQKGQQPLSTAQTAGSIQTIVNQQAATPNEPEGLLGRIRNDVFSLVDIPKIVGGLVSEVQQLPNAPQKLSEVLGRGNIPDILSGLQEVPGIRDIPGVYTLSQLPKGPGGLLEHPVYSALDILPFLKEPVASLANAAVESERFPETAARVAEARQLGAYADRNQLLQTLGLPEQPEPTPFQLARQESPTLQQIRTSAIGQQIRSRFGTMAEDISQLATGDLSRLRASTNVNVPLDHPAIDDLRRPIAAAIRDMDQYRAIPDDRRLELTGAAMRPPMRPDGTPGSWEDVLARPDLTDQERGFLQAAHDHADTIAQVAISHDWPLANLDGEIYTRDEAGKIQEARQAYDRQSAVNQSAGAVRDLFTGPTRTEFPTTIDSSSLLQEGLGNKAVRGMAYNIAHQINLSGFDSAPLEAALATKKPSPQSLVDAIEQIRANPTARPIFSPEDMQGLMAPYAHEEAFQEPGNAYSRVMSHLKYGNYRAAANVFRDTIYARKEYTHPQAEVIMDSLRRFRDADTQLSNLERDFNSRLLTKTLNAKNKVEEGIIPARFHPYVEQLAQQKLMDMYSTDPEALKLISQNLARQVPELRDNPQLLNDAYNESLATVQQLRKEGLNPLYVHKVSPGQVPEVQYPRLSDVLREPSFVKARTFDASPYIEDAALAVSHQGAEALTRMSVESFLDNFMKLYGRSPYDAINEYLPMAQSLNRMDPSKSVGAYAEEAMRREYKKYDPKSIFPTSQIKLGTFPKEQELWIPRPAERVLHDLFRSPGGFTGVFDPIMNAFRMSVLTFRPAWQVNNIGGGAMLMGVQEPRTILTALTKMREVRDMLRASEMDRIPGMPPSGFGQVSGDVEEWAKRATTMQQVFAAHQWLGASTIGRWVQEAEGGPFGGRVAGAFRKAADVSYRVNGLVDDFYRIIAYITGRDKALTGGMSEREAQQAGVALVRKVLPEWDRVTPFERNVVRSIFPFYTFAKFITRYAMRFPMDHPVRMAVMSSLARNEMNEFGDWLPLKFASMFFLGHPDAKGNTRAISLGGLNPFQDVANYFTLQGYLGKVNPIISAVLETAGIDPSKGTQDLYPDIAYDPNTGTLKPRNPSLLSNLLGNVIPQTQVVSALIGRNKNFSGLLQANPEAASAFLRSSIGLPNLFPQYNLPQEATRAEVQRESLQDQVRNEALRTGDWSRAVRFPGLQTFFAQLNQVLQTNPQALQAYRSATQQGTSDAFFNALVSRSVPIG